MGGRNESLSHAEAITERLLEILDRLLQAAFEFDGRAPAAEPPGREGDVRFSLLRVVAWQGVEDDLGFRAGQPDDPLGELEHREFVRISGIHRTGEIVFGRHHAYHRLDQVVHILEAPGLSAVAIDRDALAAKRLNDEIRDDPSVVGIHSGPIGVEYPL